ncbi:MAG: class I SAM-dependent methyltransferase [Candidatus Uhrbacteria bacterium]|nr:class I SAM-dependent methyltransferase [Candidatus Uhrbacteria bacterium]
MTIKSWDKTWEKIYRSKEWGKYPPEELVRFVAHNYYKTKDRKAIKILDVGCGTGAATWFIAREEFDAYGIDGSPTAIKIAKKRFAAEKLKGHFQVGDIISLPFKDDEFDAVTDIASIQHNSFKNIKKIVDETYRVLKPDGKFFSMMIAEDKSLSDWSGVIHFFTLAEIKKVFSIFSSASIDYVARTRNNGRGIQKFWLIEATK